VNSVYTQIGNVVFLSPNNFVRFHENLPGDLYERSKELGADNSIIAAGYIDSETVYNTMLLEGLVKTEGKDIPDQEDPRYITIELSKELSEYKIGYREFKEYKKIILQHIENPQLITEYVRNDSVANGEQELKEISMMEFYPPFVDKYDILGHSVKMNVNPSIFTKDSPKPSYRSTIHLNIDNTILAISCYSYDLEWTQNYARKFTEKIMSENIELTLPKPSFFDNLHPYIQKGLASGIVGGAVLFFLYAMIFIGNLFSRKDRSEQ